MTMTDSAVRTYSVGDTSDDYVYAPQSLRTWCGERNMPGAEYSHYQCSLPRGHTGPQHVAANERMVVGVKDRDTSGDDHTLTLLDGRRVQVPEAIYPTVRDEQAAYTRLLDEVRAELARTRDALLAERRAHEGLQADHDQFRRDVVDKAMDLARRHDWCSVVQQGLIEMGLGDLLTKEFRVTATIRAERTVTLRVTAMNGDDAWQKVDRMNGYDLAEAYEAENGGDFDRDVMDDGDWEYQSVDASTSTEEIED